MADISQITVNDVTYTIKDQSAREAAGEAKNTATAASNTAITANNTANGAKSSAEAANSAAQAAKKAAQAAQTTELINTWPMSFSPITEVLRDLTQPFQQSFLV